LERRRSQAFRARLGGAQKPPAHELLKISVSVSEETRNRDLRSAAGDFAQKPPSGEAADGAAPPHGAESSYGAGLPLHSLARQIHRDVGPSLQRGVALKVAQAVVAGFIDGADVERAIIRAHDLVADGRCKAPFVFFVGAMQSKFAERGAEWQARRGGRR
jgi:hypothetical protein